VLTGRQRRLVPVSHTRQSSRDRGSGERRATYYWSVDGQYEDPDGDDHRGHSVDGATTRYFCESFGDLQTNRSEDNDDNNDDHNDDHDHDNNNNYDNDDDDDNNNNNYYYYYYITIIIITTITTFRSVDSVDGAISCN